MTEQNYPINPPPKLVQQWVDEYIEAKPHCTAPEFVTTRAAQWGAEQMWEACRGEIIDGVGRMYIVSVGSRVRLADDLGSILHPKPPSLKEQALKDVDVILKNPGSPVHSDFDRIISALKSIPDPS